jgi:hypothetical protein
VSVAAKPHTGTRATLVRPQSQARQVEHRQHGAGAIRELSGNSAPLNGLAAASRSITSAKMGIRHDKIAHPKGY